MIEVDLNARQVETLPVTCNTLTWNITVTRNKLNTRQLYWWYIVYTSLSWNKGISYNGVLSSWNESSIALRMCTPFATTGQSSIE